MFGKTHTIDFKDIKPGEKKVQPDGTYVYRSECGHIYKCSGPTGEYTIDMRDWNMTPRKKPTRFRNTRSLV